MIISRISKLLQSSYQETDAVCKLARHYGVTSCLMSQFPKDWVEPTFRLEDLHQMRESGEIKEKAFTRFKPAKANVSSSVFYDLYVQKFVTYITKHGRKEVARRIMDGTLYEVKRLELQKLNDPEYEDKDQLILDPITVIHAAIENCRPLLQVRPTRKGALIYQVPVPLQEGKSISLAMKWLVAAARDKGNAEKFEPVMAKELVDAAYNKGRVVKKKQDLHKLCEANRAYAHFRWSA